MGGNMQDGSGRIRQQVTDVSSASELLRYATAGQLARLQLYMPGMGLARIAQGARLGLNPRSAGANLAKALRDGLSPKDLEGLDEIIGALNPDVARTGGLSSLALRLSAEP